MDNMNLTDALKIIKDVDKDFLMKLSSEQLDELSKLINEINDKLKDM